MRRVTVVLDDDPTGTQSSENVAVLLEWTVEELTRELERTDSLYLQTNTRAVDEPTAVRLMVRIRDELSRASSLAGVEVRVVLRGDSTLRGHVFSETSQFLERDGVILFVPAFPAGGRVTLDGVHQLRDGENLVPVHATEYAQDPVFPFETSVLTDYVHQMSGREASSVGLAEIRGGGLAAALLAATPGSVVVADAETDEDIRLVASQLAVAEKEGARVIVRCAAPLAAELAGVSSRGGLLPSLARRASRILVVCGSHTSGATAQLAELTAVVGEPVIIPSDEAMADPVSAGRAAARRVEAAWERCEVVAVTSERQRRSEHSTLDHGARVMEALITTVTVVGARAEALVAKGGITSAEVARRGAGARMGLVLGQLEAGISLWSLHRGDGEEQLYAVVPGNVGDSGALLRTVRALSAEDMLPLR